jgi:hypothetical protein
MSKIEINHSIMKENVIDKEELINYLTLILEEDGELEKFYDREGLRENEEDPVPDVLSFRDWLRDQTFDTIIRESYFEEYIKELMEDIGDYNPNCFLHRHINWERVYKEILYRDYDGIFECEEDAHNIFREDFCYHI